jgi:hypothetical protein
LPAPAAAFVLDGGKRKPLTLGIRRELSPHQRLIFQ